MSFLLFEFKYKEYYPNNKVFEKLKSNSRGSNQNSPFSRHQHLTHFAKLFWPQAAVVPLTTSALMCSSHFLPQTLTKSQPKAQETSTSHSHAASTAPLPECSSSSGHWWPDCTQKHRAEELPLPWSHIPEWGFAEESGKPLLWEMCWQRLRAGLLCSKNWHLSQVSHEFWDKSFKMQEEYWASVILERNKSKGSDP